MNSSSSKDADIFAAKRNAHYNRYYKTRRTMTPWQKDRMKAGARKYQQSLRGTSKSSA